MLKIFIVSFSRASEGALSKLKKEMGEMLTTSLEEADYILAVGDRKETFDFVLGQWREGKKILHLWAGEGNTNTKDDVYRNAMTLMSEIQLCTNYEAVKVVELLCLAAKKHPCCEIVGNVMMDNLEIDESLVPKENYDLFLINKPYGKGYPYIIKEGEGDDNVLLWKNLSRPKFLGLLKNCKRFMTNSSCEYYEAPLFLKPEQIIHIGERNKERGSKYADMKIKNATKNIIKALQSLEEAKNTKE